MLLPPHLVQQSLVAKQGQDLAWILTGSTGLIGCHYRHQPKVDRMGSVPIALVVIAVIPLVFVIYHPNG
jgi:hypothetical protein